ILILMNLGTLWVDKTFTSYKSIFLTINLRSLGNALILNKKGSELMRRRSFLAASVASTCAWAVNAADIKPTDGDTETDVLVIGFGGAGGAAAIEACDCKARVLVVEKSPEGGGNTSVSSGGIMIPDNKEDAYVYLEKTFNFADSEMDPKLLRIFVDEIVQQRPFLESLGEDVQIFMYGGAGFPTLPHADTIKKYSFRYGGKTGGPALFEMYRNAVINQRKIPVWFNSPAKCLIVSDGKVVGAQVEKEGKLVNVKACKGVILTCGGYENSPEKLKVFAQGKDIKFMGTPYNTGDGLNMAEAVGAKLWHMTAYSCPLGAKVPGKVAMDHTNCPAAGIWVDQDAKRFVNEKRIDSHNCLYEVQGLDPVQLRYPRIPSYLIFDEKARMAGPVGGASSGWISIREGYKWSKDNTAEIEAGIIKQAQTIEELAKIICVDPEVLKCTIETWNKDVAEGKDTVEGRAMKNKQGKVISLPIDKPPYFALELIPSLLNTQGGPRKTADCQVINVFGECIPGLYAAGELGSMWGQIYQGACNNAESLVFGRRAGRAVASL
ncbi:MAG: FAD-binding protein, partial [Burkholderiales bacterium]|nr:FAD-binding protein [Burkholderiales bacterium]